MAKMKVYELAKELGMESKELVSELQNRGIEVKNHMSALEEGQVSEIKNSFSTKKEAPVNKSAEQTPAEEDKKADGAAPHKKKKTIIFVSNPHNSKMPGSQVPKQRPQGEKKQNVAKHPEKSAVAKPVAAPEVKAPEQKTVASVEPKVATQTAPVENKVINEEKARVVEKPVVNEAVEKKVVENQNTNDTPVKTEEVKNQDMNQNKLNDQNNRQYSDNRQNNNGRTYNNNNNYHQNDNRQNGNRNNNNRNNDNRQGGYQNRQNNGNYQQSDRRQGGYGDNRRQDGQRPNNGQRPVQDRQGRPGFSNDNRNRQGNGRPQRPDGRQNDQFRGKPGIKAAIPESPVKDMEKRRDDEKRRQNQDRDKRSKKDLIYAEDDGDFKGKNKPGKFIKPEKKVEEKVEEQIKVITIPDSITIKDLADKMRIQPSAIVKKLFLQGQIVTVNQEVSFETAENIAIEYEIICEKEVKVDVIEELLKEDEEQEENLIPRSPVICVMGHVDHGKTSLLDAIRKTNVTDKEAGGITQHIGAYTVNVNGQKITFLDTPGHEAFTAMRMRGANATDIAILVVAADDGVMPQTVEAINHAKAAGIEIIVAVNKIDKPGANIDRVKQELAEYELIPEDWGGSTVFAPVSAKSGEGIEQLLEMILLTSEILELKANPDRKARGLVIEAELDKGRGPVATILVQKGTLHVGDFVSAGASHGKVRAMIDDKGRRVKEAGPSTPVEILGLNDVPNAGEIFIAHANDKEAKNFAETFIAQNKEKLLEDTKAKMSLDDLFSQIQAGNLKELNLIIKADVQGSVEAVKQSLLKLSNEEVVVKCIHGGVGAINESDVILASASNAIIIGFNVRPDAQAKATSEREGVDVRLYKVIYQAIEDIEAAMKGMLDPVFEEKVIGHAEVRQIFKASAVGNIAGSYVMDGVFQRGCKVRITREGEQIYEGALASLKRFKDDVKEVKTGFECGLVFEGFDGMKELDIVEAYIMVEVPR